jgi:hypothetical protein
VRELTTAVKKSDLSTFLRRAPLEGCQQAERKIYRIAGFVSPAAGQREGCQESAANRQYTGSNTVGTLTTFDHMRRKS